MRFWFDPQAVFEKPCNSSEFDTQAVFENPATSMWNPGTALHFYFSYGKKNKRIQEKAWPREEA